MTLLPAYMDEYWKCYEQMAREDREVFDPMLVNVSPEFCHKSVLVFLAYETDVDISGFDTQTARKMIRAAINATQYAGTVAAVVENIEAISSEAKVTEWQDYGGQEYHFKVDIDVTDYGVDEEMIVRLEKTALKKKNVRSVLEVVRVNLTTSSKIRTAAVTQVGEVATLYPYQLTEIEFNHVINNKASMMQSVETLYIYPKGA